MVCLPEAPCGRVRWRWHPPLPGFGPGEDLDWPGAQPVPRFPTGAAPRVPWPRFGWIYTNAESGWKSAESRGTGRSGSHARRDRPSKKPTPLPQRRRPHANQIKGRSRLVVRPAARTRVTARTPHRGRAAARRRSRCRARECTGRHAALLLSSMPSFLCLLLSREARPCVFSMQCLLLEKRAGETTVCVSQHNIPFKKKHWGGGHMRGSN